jgi:hypothetical protein
MSAVVAAKLEGSTNSKELFVFCNCLCFFLVLAVFESNIIKCKKQSNFFLLLLCFILTLMRQRVYIRIVVKVDLAQV